MSDERTEPDVHQDDLARNTALLNAELPDPRFVDTSYLRWLYDENPFGPASQAHRDDEAGMRIGHYANVMQDYRGRQGEARFVFSLNAVIRSGSQRRGLFRELCDEVWSTSQSRGVKMLVGVTNARSTPPVARYGARVMGPMPVTMVVPSPRPPHHVDSYDITPEFLTTPAFDDLAQGLDQSPAWHWTNRWTPAQMRWRLGSPNGMRYALHRSHELVGISGLTHQNGIPVAVVLKLLPRDGRFGPLSAQSLITAMCRHHGAPLAVYAGFNRHVRVRGLPLPARLKPSPLNVVCLSLHPDCDQTTFQLDTFEFLDMDAY